LAVRLPVIVTRTLPGAHDTAENLARLGFAPLISPMLSITETGLSPRDLSGIRHLIFTSANGVRAARGVEVPPDVTAWCVGPSTADAAREAGFATVVEGDGNAEDLARLILCAHPIGPLLHIANEAAAGDLVAALKSGGLEARFSAPYRTDAAASLSAEARDALAGVRGDEERVRKMRSQPLQHRRIGDLVHLVEYDDRRAVPRAEFLQHVNRRLVKFQHLGRARIQQMHEKVRLHGLLESGLERLDETVRKLAHKAHRVREQEGLVRGQRDLARRRV
jgi:hypothetical protein